MAIKFIRERKKEREREKKKKEELGYQDWAAEGKREREKKKKKKKKKEELGYQDWAADKETSRTKCSGEPLVTVKEATRQRRHTYTQHRTQHIHPHT